VVKTLKEENNPQPQPTQPLEAIYYFKKEIDYMNISHN
jgi:hypothetical protein